MQCSRITGSSVGTTSALPHVGLGHVPESERRKSQQAFAAMAVPSRHPVEVLLFLLSG